MNRLQGQRVLAVNDAIFLVLARALPLVTTSFFTLDNVWVRRYRTFLEGLGCEKFVALPPDSWLDCHDIPGITYLRWGFEFGMSTDPEVINTGGNSGYGALNAAFLKGSKEIHLVGFDMDPNEDDKYAQWIRWFRPAAAQLKSAGVQVINHNLDSHIDAFDKAA